MFGALINLLQNLHKKKILTVPHGNCYLLASEDGTTVNKTEITSLFSYTVYMHKSKAVIQLAFAVVTVCVFHIAAPSFQVRHHYFV